MCGIAGIIPNSLNCSMSATQQTMQVMLDVMNHRGPDDCGIWYETSSGVCLGHNRLSIIDLSESGHQPMHSSCNRYCISYNGEIYNTKSLRTELTAYGRYFQGHSDTEVLVEGCSEWGVENMVNKLVGMFAFAIWDKQDRLLYLVRDRLGIKNLYWGHFGGLFLFASELKALRQHPSCPKSINRTALTSYFRHNYIPTAETIYNDIYKLKPGELLTVSAEKALKTKQYWSLADAVTLGNKKIFMDDKTAITKLDELLREVVSCRMMADVSLGAFLSGGIDSSLVVALMQEQSVNPVNTFSIGFEEDGYNEAKHAEKIAHYLGTNHNELYVSSKEAQLVIPQLADIFDEPFSDSSQIPTYLVSKMAREHVSVVLSGDGGDECFSGYTRYYLANRIDKIQRVLPKGIRELIKSSIQLCPPRLYDQLVKLLPDNFRPYQFGHRLHKFADILNEEQDDYYRRLISHWIKPEEIVIDGQENLGLIWDKSLKKHIPDFIERMRYLDMMTYLPDDILTKVDRASMSVSLEARVPLLDHRLVEFSWRLPKSFHIRDGQGKWPLRQVLYNYIPRELVERPKMGFSVPIDKWLRGPLRDWAETLLDERRLKNEGYLNPKPIREKWQQHISGRYNWQYLLWNVLIFQCWHERWR